jgi:hypothetical protein
MKPAIWQLGPFQARRSHRGWLGGKAIWTTLISAAIFATLTVIADYVG